MHMCAHVFTKALTPKDFGTIVLMEPGSVLPEEISSLIASIHPWATADLEKRLLESVLSTDPALRTIFDQLSEAESKVVHTKAFENWAPLLETKRIVHSICEQFGQSSATFLESGLDVASSVDGADQGCSQGVFTKELELRKQVHASLFRRMEAPYDTNRWRSQIAEGQNPWFEDAALQCPRDIAFSNKPVFSGPEPR